jgi:hypothetical protein
MRIIKRREHHEESSYLLTFEYADSPGSGFSFPCHQDGKVKVDNLSELGRKNYVACMQGRVSVIRGTQYDRDNEPIPGTGKVFMAEVLRAGVQEYKHAWSSPAIGECNHCGEEVLLSGFTNECRGCNTDYNSSGQELAPRECWGEDSGESVSDILSVDSGADPFDCCD